jgi:hypothetical protein
MAANGDDSKPAILNFLARIGLPVRLEPLEGRTFMPGVTTRSGALVVDEEQLLYPGDLLHEAGHMAVMSAAERTACDGNATGDEMAAIAWSYAAALEIGIDPLVVFHEHGYRSGGANIVENFSEGRYFGVPLLQWFGMTRERAAEGGSDGEMAAYPKMQRWLRG